MRNGRIAVCIKTGGGVLANSFTGDVAEVLFFSRESTDAEFAQVGAFLEYRFGLDLEATAWVDGTACCFNPAAAAGSGHVRADGRAD